MLNLHRSLSRISISSLISKPLTKTLPTDPQIASNGFKSIEIPISQRLFSTSSGIGGGGKRDDDDEQSDPWSKPWESSTDSSDMGWDSVSTWSTGLTKDHFDGEVVGRKVNPSGPQSETPRSSSAAQGGEEQDSVVAELLEENKWSEKFVNSWNQRMSELNGVMKQVREPGMRGEYLKDSEKAEMYRLHKSDPEVYTVEKLAKDYRIMRQRVHAILWLKELEEQEEKERGPLDDSVELLLDTCPEFFVSHDREFHLASLPYKPDFKVMPEGWDGTTRDPDEVHYEISMKEDEMLYQEFVQRMNFNKMKFAGKVNKHIYSRRRSDKGWKITVEKLGPEGKRGRDKFSGGWKYVSEPDGSSRPLNDIEKMYLQRETPRRRKKILP